MANAPGVAAIRARHPAGSDATGRRAETIRPDPNRNGPSHGSNAPPAALFYDQIPPDSGVALRKRTRTIPTYARCGFANFGRIRIQIHGIVGINPEPLPENAAAANTL